MQAGEVHVNSGGPRPGFQDSWASHCPKTWEKSSTITVRGTGMLSIGEAEWPAGTGSLYIVRMVILFKLIYRFKTIPSKTPAGFYAEIHKPILKFVWKWKGSRKSKRILKKNIGKGLILSSFKMYLYKMTEIKTVWYWHKDRYTEQWNRESRNKSFSCQFLVKLWVFSRKCQGNSIGKGLSFQQILLGQ